MAGTLIEFPPSLHFRQTVPACGGDWGLKKLGSRDVVRCSDNTSSGEPKMTERKKQSSGSQPQHKPAPP